MSFTYIGTPERYRHTIQRIYEMGRDTPAFREGDPRFSLENWVTSRLIGMHHWAALEEHLQNVDAAANASVDRRERDRSRPPGATAPPLAPGTTFDEGGDR